MSNEYSVLIVDDSPADLQLVLNVVKEEYNVLAATSGQQAIDMVNKANPHLVLLDVTMPEMDGYEACRQIKANQPDTLVIFLSANDTTEEILQGYDVGASDYVVKPFEPDVLLNKIKGAFEAQQKNRELKQEADYASEVAMAAISSSSELSIVVNFLRDSFHATNLQDLSKLVITCLADYGLIGSMQLRQNAVTAEFSTAGVVSNLENELLNRIALMKDRIYENQARMFLNFNQASLLIKNIPLDDPDKVGRLRDYLMILVEGMNEKLEYFMAEENAIKKRNESITSVITKVNDSLQFIHQAQKEIEKKNVDILDSLADDVEEAFLGLGLTEEQEDSIMQLLKVAHDESEKVFEKGAVVDETMEDVLKIVTQLKEG